jgi:hypothetical protein
MTSHNISRCPPGQAKVGVWEVSRGAQARPSVGLQYVWGQDVDRFLKLGNFASTT